MKRILHMTEAVIWQQDNTKFHSANIDHLKSLSNRIYYYILIAGSWLLTTGHSTHFESGRDEYVPDANRWKSNK